LLGNMFQAGPMLPALPVFGNFELLLAFAGIGFMELVHLSERTETIVDRVGRWPAFLRWAVYLGVTMWILVFGAIGKEQAFIYFQF
ncbi:MAG: hypothetical protein AAGI08_03775, partial [Bacteroidota bacterium]